MLKNCLPGCEPNPIYCTS